jgi:hypothetical protein
MPNHSVLLFAVAAVVSLPTCLHAQRPPALSTDSLVRSSAATASGTYTPSTVAMIENRARTLGDRVDGSGTRYFAVTDADLIGKKPEEIIQRLSPTIITAGDQVRKMEILVDLQRPITLYTDAKQPVNIGTAIVQGAGLNNIDVHSSIFANAVQVVTK